MDKLFKVTNDEDAWQLIELWLSGQPIPTLEFSGWPTLRITINGDHYESSLRSGQMEALIGFKQSMGRAYAAIVHGAYDKRRLKKVEDERLEFTTTVKKGSSITETDLSPLVHAAAQVMQTHQIETLIAAVVIGLALVARPLVLKHFENKAKQMDIDERRDLISLTSQITPQDRARAKTHELATKRLSKKFPSFEHLVPDVATSFWHLANSTADADLVTIGNDVELTAHHLEILSERRRRRKSKNETVEDTFEVSGIVKIDQNYRLQLRSDTAIFSVLYRPPTMTEAKIKRLMNCMTSSRTVDAKISIRSVEGAQVSGELLSFRVTREPSNDGGTVNQPS